MSEPPLPPHLRLRVRGAASNRTGRHEGVTREAIADGWDIPEDERLLTTEVRVEQPRSALVWNRSPDLFFDRAINPYRGCEHGCIYCYARPSHAQLGLSSGLDFESRLIARPGIAAVLDRELRARNYRPAVIGIGTNTDPYQPCEARFAIMRAVLAVLADFRHPVAITTKGTLIERDIDLLAPLATAGLVAVAISLATLDADLARRLDPRAPAPARRLATIGRLAAAGIPVRVMVAPVIPGLTDHEVEALVAAGADAGATTASCITLRLPHEVAPLFRDWLARHAPGRAAHVMGRMREMRGGRDYDAAFDQRMTGQGVWAALLARRFALACRRAGLGAGAPPLRNDRFRVPPRPGDQLDLFAADPVE